MRIQQEILKAFREDLCKDQREMQIIDDKKSKTGSIVRKYSTSQNEFNNEKSVMKYLAEAGIVVPAVLSEGQSTSNGKMYLDLEYHKGIRVFNLLAYIRNIQENFPQYRYTLRIFKEKLLARCLENQKKIQQKLLEWSRKNQCKACYPKEKLSNIVRILSDLYSIQLDKSEIEKELEYITKEFNNISIVPFRDSTTKNMVIAYPKLYLGNYLNEKGMDQQKADKIRQDFFLQMIQENKYEKILESKIVDFDFSSCENLTSLYDDPIGFLCHEITFKGIPKPEELIWLGNNPLDSRGIALSFIVRFLRFGGRKLAYHVIHPHAYEYRFKYDNEFFYFDHFESIIDHFWPDSVDTIPELMKLIQSVRKLERLDLFDNVDEYENLYRDCYSKFYLDIFPY